MEPLRRTFRGYEPAQVDRLVSGLYSQLETRLREIEELRHQNTLLNEELADRRESQAALEQDEKAIRAALVSAHRQAEDVLAQARKDAEILLEVAREAASRYQEDLRGRIDDLNWQIERLTLQKQRFMADFRGLLEANLVQLAAGEPSDIRPAVAQMQDEAPLEPVIQADEAVVAEVETPVEAS